METGPLSPRYLESWPPTVIVSSRRLSKCLTIHFAGASLNDVRCQFAKWRERWLLVTNSYGLMGSMMLWRS